MKFDFNFLTSFILPIISIIISIIIFLLQKTKKELTYKIIFAQDLPTFDKSINELNYPDKEIVIEYTNTGNIALEKVDFHSPIEIYFPKAKIINAKKHYTSNNDIYFDIKFDSSKASFTPDLLNPGESIILNFYVQEFHNSINTSTKIKNGKPISNQLYDNKLKNKIIMIIIIYLLFLVFNFYQIDEISLSKENFKFFLELLVFLLLWFVWDYRLLKHKQFI